MATPYGNNGDGLDRLARWLMKLRGDKQEAPDYAAAHDYQRDYDPFLEQAAIDADAEDEGGNLTPEDREAIAAYRAAEYEGAQDDANAARLLAMLDGRVWADNTELTSDFDTLRLPAVTSDAKPRSNELETCGEEVEIDKQPTTVIPAIAGGDAQAFYCPACVVRLMSLLVKNGADVDSKKLDTRGERRYCADHKYARVARAVAAEHTKLETDPDW